jgi:hypothetical protein
MQRAKISIIELESAKGAVRMRTIVGLSALLLCCIRPGIAAADGPSTLPSIPALIEGSKDSPAFVVDGVIRESADQGLGFHFAADGKKRICALFDPADSTPIYLSDGDQTLIYDLSNSRIICAPTSKACVTVDWNPKADQPMRFKFNLGFGEDAKTINSSFRIDRFVDASQQSLREIEAHDSYRLLAAPRAGNNLESIEIPRDQTWFRFSSQNLKDDYFILRLDARIGGQIPAAAVAFPDPDALRRDIAFLDLDQQTLPGMISFLSDNRGAAAKLGLAFEGMRGFADKILLSPDWDQLKKRDQQFGTQYRTALSHQGIKFSLPVSEGTTRPATRP